MRSSAAFSLTLLGAALAFVLGPAPSVVAQLRFSTIEQSAREVAPDRLADELSVLLTDCTQSPSPSAKRSCISNRRRAGRDVLRNTYLIELPAAGHVRFGSYEPSNGGFRIFVDGFALPPREAGGVLSTAPTRFGLLPSGQTIGTGFGVVPWISAAPWLEVHRPSELTLRVIVRAGDDFEDPNASDVRARYGVRLVVVGIQIFANASGDVLVDTLADHPPPAPPPLTDRMRLWSHEVRAETLFVASEDTQVDLNVRIEPREPGDTSMTAVLMQNVGANATELYRVTTPCCSSSIDVERQGSSKLLVIVTEQSAAAGGLGSGRVVLFEWTGGTFVQRAEWVGSNGSVPPAWVLDPNVDP